MAQAIEFSALRKELPGWVSDDIRLYLDHVEGGCTIRALARDSGVHASTVLRKVRKTESRRDDPLVDKVLIHLGRLRRVRGNDQSIPDEVKPDMTDAPIDEETLKRDATRILRALMQPGAVLAVVGGVDTAIVVRESADGRPRQVATVASPVAEAMALQGWISFTPQGKVARYYITPKGRVALNRFLAETESQKASGFDEGPARFHSATPAGKGNLRAVPNSPSRRAIGAEPPLQVLARRRDKAGQPYMPQALVEVGERLRMDFELAQMHAQMGPNWNSIMAGAVSKSTKAGQGPDLRAMEARGRLEQALRFLGPELGDVTLLTCCHQHGMEHAEKELAMPARSGKFVLRIALNMLARHYAAQGDDGHNLIY